MPTYSNWDQLTKAIQKAVDQTLKKDVAPIVEQKLHKNAQVMAAGDWSRKVDGIADADNIVSEVEDGTLVTMDVAYPQEPLWGSYDNTDRTTFGRWIDQGEWMDLNTFLQTGVKEKRAARPFITQTQEEINNNPEEILNILDKKLNQG